MSFAVAHGVCLLLATLDVGARAWRYVLLLAGLNARLGLRQSLVLTVFGDAVADVTPMRLGGEPARILGARHDGVPVGRAIVALALENVLTYLVLIPTGVAIAVRYGADWWHTIANLNPRLLRGLVITLAVAVAIVAAFLLWRRKRPTVPNDETIRREGLGELGRDLLRFPPRLLVPCLLLSGVSLAARVGILPVVALASPNPPTLGAATVASLALLYGQLVLPTPSGAGPIDVAVLGGASGVTLAAGKVLGVWRLYTTVLPIAVGLLSGSLAYGRAILSLIPRRGRNEAGD